MLVQFRICGFDLLFLDLEIAGSETEPSDLVAALATAAKLELTATPRCLAICNLYLLPGLSILQSALQLPDFFVLGCRCFVGSSEALVNLNKAIEFFVALVSLVAVILQADVALTNASISSCTTGRFATMLSRSALCERSSALSILSAPYCGSEAAELV